MGRRRAWRELLALLVAEVLAVVVLHRLGRVDGLTVPWRSLGEWLTGAPPEDVIGATLRLAALALAWWLLASSALYLVTSAAGAPRAARAIARTTLPVVCRWTQRALTASVVAGAALGVRPAAAAPPPSTGPTGSPPAIVVEIDHRDPATREVDPTTVPSVRSGRAGGLESAPVVAAPPPPFAAPAPPPSPEPAAVDPAYVVVGGDSLWSIAASRLAQLSERPVSEVDEREIATYWAVVVDANGNRLRSGDPNLIFPGELLDLPPA